MRTPRLRVADGVWWAEESTPAHPSSKLAGNPGFDGEAVEGWRTRGCGHQGFMGIYAAGFQPSVSRLLVP